MHFDEGGEGGVDLAIRAGLQDWELHVFRARRFLHVSYHGLGFRVVRVHQQGDHLGLGNQLAKQFEPLGRQLVEEDAETRNVAAGPGEIGDQAGPDRITDAGEDDRDRRGSAFRRQCRREAAAGHDHVDLAAGEVCGQCGQPIIVSLRPAVFDRDVMALDIAGVAKTLAERIHIRCARAG